MYLLSTHASSYNMVLCSQYLELIFGIRNDVWKLTIILHNAVPLWLAFRMSRSGILLFNFFDKQEAFSGMILSAESHLHQ